METSCLLPQDQLIDDVTFDHFSCSCSFSLKTLSNLRVEEDLWAQEAFIAHVDVEGVLTDGIYSMELFDPFPRVTVVLSELLHNVWTDVTVPLLHTDTQKTHN